MTFDLNALTAGAADTRPSDRWRPADFEAHLSAEGIPLHAHRRLGGPPVVSLTLLAIAANATLELLGDREADGAEKSEN